MTACRTCRSREEHAAIVRLAGSKSTAISPSDPASLLPEHDGLSEPTPRRRRNQPGEVARPPHELAMRRPSDDLVPGVSCGARADDEEREAEADDELLEATSRLRRPRGERTGGSLDGMPLYHKAATPPARYAAGRFDGARIPLRTTPRRATIL